MAQLPAGTLMQRAAAGLARRCAGLLADRFGGVYARRVLLLVGSGDNGGDALYAGALLARRGVAVRALLLDPDRAHAGGLAALRGGRRLHSGHRAVHSGPRAGRDPRHRRPGWPASPAAAAVAAAARRHRQRRWAARPSSPSTCRRGSRRTPGRYRATRSARTSRSPSAASSRGCWSAKVPPGPAWSNSSTSGCPRRSSRACAWSTGTTCAAGGRTRVGSRTSTPGAWSGWPPAPPTYPGAAVLSVAGASAGSRGARPVRGVGGGVRPPAVPVGDRRAVASPTPAGYRRGSAAPGSVPTNGPSPSCVPCSPPRYRRCWTRTR